MSVLTPEEIEKIKAARDAVKGEMEAAEAADPISEPERTYLTKLREQFPEETALIERYLEGRREVAKRIDPLTCQYYESYVDMLDPYGIWGNPYWCVGRDLFVYDDKIDDDCVHSHNLSDKQFRILGERIEREHPTAPTDPKVLAGIKASIDSCCIEFDAYREDWSSEPKAPAQE